MSMVESIFKKSREWYAGKTDSIRKMFIFSELFGITTFAILHCAWNVAISSEISAFFYKQRFFFQLRLSVASLFSKLSLKWCLIFLITLRCCLSKTRYIFYICLFLRLGLYVSYLCDLFWHYYFHFHHY